MPLNLGHLLHERYIIYRVLGRGGQGCVYEAYDTLEKLGCAIKESLPLDPRANAGTQDHREPARFAREAQMLLALEHPNLPRAYEYFEEAEWQYLVMEFIKGETLQTLYGYDIDADGHELAKPPPSIALALEYNEQVADALIYLHGQPRPIIHRDVNPANIIVTPGNIVKLVDFGVAKTLRAETDRLTQKLGTKGYAALEQYRGRDVDARTDVYGLAATLYATLTGHAPPESDWRQRDQHLTLTPVHKFNPQSPEALSAVIANGLALEPADRYASVEAFVAALRVAAGPLIELVPPPPVIVISPARQPLTQDAWAPPADFEWARVPAGPFLMGSDATREPESYSDETPQHSLELAEFWISRTPITLAQFAAFAKATGYITQAERAHSDWTWRQPRGVGVAVPLRARARHPVTWVTWHDAQAFCTWASVHLPSEAQWEKAARGKRARRWPWGDEPPTREHCNCAGFIGDTTPVDAYPQGASPYGLWDMAGNVWEWCSTLYRPYPYAAEDGREALDAAGLRVVRGGSLHYMQAFVRCAVRWLLNPALALGDVGFRVVTAPPAGGEA